MKIFGNNGKGKHSKGKNSNEPYSEPYDDINEINDIPDQLGDDEYIKQSIEKNSDYPDILPPQDTFSEDEELDEDELLDQPPAKGKKHKLTGVQRGLIILAAAIVFLVVVVVAAWESFSAPPVIPEAPVFASTTPTGGVQSIVSPSPSQEPNIKVTTSVVNPQDAEEIASIAEALSTTGDRQEGCFTFLLVGTDYSAYITDTIIAVKFDTVNHTVNMVSIPRDTFINLKSVNYKINSSFADGLNKGGTMESGMESLMDQVSLLLGFRLDFYCMINLEAFVEMIDVIGGIEFDVPCDMYYNDPTQDLHINLSEGLQTLNGAQCMQLVRYRSYPAADLQRIQVQQDFMKAIANKLLSIGTISKVSELARILSDNLFTNLTLGNMAWFGEELLKMDMDNISTTMLTGEAGGWNGISYYFLYGYDTVDTSNELLNPYLKEFTIDDVYVYTLENGVVSRSLRSTEWNGHAYSNYGTAAAAATPSAPEPEVEHTVDNTVVPASEAPAESSAEASSEPSTETSSEPSAQTEQQPQTGGAIEAQVEEGPDDISLTLLG